MGYYRSWCRKADGILEVDAAARILEVDTVARVDFQVSIFHLACASPSGVELV